ncbi:hypothetical protein [Companilactobacillus farciminis]|jgi:hypothetical protein|nr:hypothetical protein [Companilactobacillus farciminis]
MKKIVAPYKFFFNHKIREKLDYLIFSKKVGASQCLFDKLLKNILKK